MSCGNIPQEIEQLVLDTAERHRIIVAVRDVLNTYPFDRVFTAREVAKETGENIRKVSAILMSEHMCKRVGRTYVLCTWSDNRVGRRRVNQYRRT